VQRDQITTLLFAAEDSVRANWDSLLDAIGTQAFDRELKEFLLHLGGPHACVALDHEVLGEVLTCGARAHTTDLSPSRQCRLEVVGPPQWIYFESGIAVGIPGPVQWTHLLELSQRIVGAERALSAILRKHHEALNAASAQPEPLSCLQEIAQCVSECTELPAREAEVCSRILFGLTSAGIAVDLDVCENTVKTYRKRAYQRLNIGSERELTMWYLRTWKRWRCARSGRGLAETRVAGTLAL
jgi:DNA-binding CsgD family transcriptional regulator